MSVAAPSSNVPKAQPYDASLNSHNVTVTNGDGDGDSGGDGDGDKGGKVSSWYRICSLSDIPIGGVKCSDVGGRPLVIFRTKESSRSRSRSRSINTTTTTSSSSTSESSSPSGCSLTDGSHLYALDRICYHMGGPLDSGDIEDLHGRLVVSCPWHRYKIGLEDGTGLYQSAPGEWKSKGIRQRTHLVQVKQYRDETFDVLVQLNESNEEIASDGYCDPIKYEAMQNRMSKQQQQQQQQQQQFPHTLNPPSSSSSQPNRIGSIPGGYIRSGHLFAANRAAAAAAAAANHPQ